MDGAAVASGSPSDNSTSDFKPSSEGLLQGQIEEIRLMSETATAFLDARCVSISGDVLYSCDILCSYNHGEYGPRFHLLSARQNLNSDEFALLAAEYAFPKCDVITVYGSTLAIGPGRRQIWVALCWAG